MKNETANKMSTTACVFVRSTGGRRGWSLKAAGLLSCLSLFGVACQAEKPATDPVTNAPTRAVPDEWRSADPGLKRASQYFSKNSTDTHLADASLPELLKILRNERDEPNARLKAVEILGLSDIRGIAKDDALRSEAIAELKRCLQRKDELGVEAALALYRLGEDVTHAIAAIDEALMSGGRRVLLQRLVMVEMDPTSGIAIPRGLYNEAGRSLLKSADKYDDLTRGYASIELGRLGETAAAFEIGARCLEDCKGSEARSAALVGVNTARVDPVLRSRAQKIVDDATADFDERVRKRARYLGGHSAVTNENSGTLPLPNEGR